MNKNRIGIVDYGLGNIKSIVNALEHVNAFPLLSSDPNELSSCGRLILPGVGAFPHGMRALKSNGLDVFLRAYITSGNPFLGICLGMQMLMDLSTEFEVTNGLGFISGNVDEIQPSADNNERCETFRLPNVGWLPVMETKFSSGLGEKLLQGIEPATEFYFVHSFCTSAKSQFAAASTSYEGASFASIISRDNIAGTQFHPEKSGPQGLQMLRNFAN